LKEVVEERIVASVELLIVDLPSYEESEDEPVQVAEQMGPEPDRIGATIKDEAPWKANGGLCLSLRDEPEASHRITVYRKSVLDTRSNTSSLFEYRVYGICPYFRHKKPTLGIGSGMLSSNALLSNALTCVRANMLTQSYRLHFLTFSDARGFMLEKSYD